MEIQYEKPVYTKASLFPPYFDIIDVRLFYQGEEFSTTAEQDDYIAEDINMHDKMYTLLKDLLDNYGLGSNIDNMIKDVLEEDF